MTVSADDVAAWSRQAPPDPDSPEGEVLARVLAAVVSRAVAAFRLAPDPAEWSVDQDQAVIEVAAEQWIGSRNTQFGAGEFDTGPTVHATTIDVGLRRRLGIPWALA